MVNRTGEQHRAPRLQRQTPRSSVAPTVQYATGSAADPNAGRGLMTLSGVLQQVSGRLEDRQDLIAQIEASREGTIAGRDGLPERGDDSTIRGRAFNMAASDSLMVQTETAARKALTEYEDAHQSDPKGFKVKADGWLQGALPGIESFDPKLALQIKSDFEARADSAINRIKDRAMAIARDNQVASTTAYQLTLQDEMASDARNLFNNGPIETQKMLTRMMSNAAKLSDTATMIGPDGRPLFDGRSRALLQRQAEKGVAEQFGLAWVRSQENMAQGIIDLQNGNAFFEVPDGPREDGRTKKVNVRDMIGEDVLSSVLPDITDKGMREAAEQQSLLNAATAEARSSYELRIASATSAAELDGMVREIDRNVDGVGGVIQANDLKQRIIGKTKDYREKLESVSRGSAFANGSAYLNPESSQSVKDFNNYYENTVLPQLAGLDQDHRNTLLTNIIDRSRVVPDAIKGDIKAASRSRRKEEVIAAADLIDRIRSVNPNMAADFSSKDVNRLETVRANLEAGYDDDEAFDRADTILDPANEAMVKLRRDEIKRAKIDFRDKALTSIQPSFAWRMLPGRQGVDDTDSPGPTPQQSIQMGADYQRAYESHYVETGNADLAEKHASLVIKRSYGMTSINGQNQIMKYAPENYYGVPGLSIDENTEWMRKEIIGEGKKRLKERGIVLPDDYDAKSNIFLVPDPYVTPRTARKGRPYYKIMYTDPANGALRDALDADEFFQPSTSSAADSIIEKARASAAGRTEGRDMLYSGVPPIGGVQ